MKRTLLLLLTLTLATPVLGQYLMALPEREPPTFDQSTPLNINAAENQTAVTTVSATGEGTITYSLSGTDDEFFSIGPSTGVITFNSAPNYENPLDADFNNVYTFTANASNGSVSSITVNVTVTDESEGSPEAPTIVNADPLNVNVQEGATTIATITATGDAPLTYSVSGTDADDVSIGSSSGVLVFDPAPDYEIPTDDNMDNLYTFTVTASNGVSPDDSITVNATVADENESDIALLFSDLTHGPKSGWSAADPNQGAAVSIWTDNLGTGTTRGSNYVTVNGVDLTDDTDYAEWCVPQWDVTTPVGSAPAGGFQIYRTTFWLNSSCTDGAGTISVTVGGNTSNTIPFTVISGNIYFVDKDHGGTNSGTLTNPWTVPDRANTHTNPGDITYFRETATPYNGKYSGGNQNFYWSGDEAGVSGSPKAVVSYPGEMASLQAEDTVNNIIANFNGVPDYWTISKFNMVARAYCVGTGLGKVGIRVVGNQCEGINTTTVALAGIIFTQSGDTVVLGNAAYGGRSHNKLDHAIYISGNPSNGTNGVELAWNYVYDNDFESGPLMVINHQSNRIPTGSSCPEHTIHHNYLDSTTYPSRGIGIYSQSWEVGNPYSEDEPEYALIYNNVTRGCSLASYIANGKGKWFNNSFLDNSGIGFQFGGTDNLDTQFINNIVTMDGGANEYLDDTTADAVTETIDNNLWYGLGTAPAYDSSAVNSDPILTSTYKLDTGSPAIDAGADTSAVVTDDIDSNARDASIDIGANELQ